MLQKGKSLAVIMSFLLLLILCAGLLSVQVSAQENTADDEPEISVTTDKAAYTNDEKITETVIIKNTTGSRLTDVNVQASIPDSYVTADGKEAPASWVSEVMTLSSGDNAEIPIVLTRKETSTDGENGNLRPGGNQTDVTPPDNKKPAEHDNMAKTGDSAAILFSVMLVLLSLTAIVFIIKKKKGRKMLSFILALTLAGGMLVPGGATNAAEPETVTVTEKSKNLTKDIVIGDKNVTLTVRVDYKIETVEEAKKDLSYEGYSLVWEDEFNGVSLNLNDWNIELHEPGWVNSELQAYTDSADNIYVKDGNLVLKPIKTVDGNGNVSYTSGRINTQKKHDFKYGLFEARVKVPAGQGFLPAFWMMPTNENLYGQWPRCGEIDIMEVLGNKTDTSYGTIHFGNPHSESQGNYTLKEGDFAEEYHVFSAEWEPGKISWYVDGVLIHTENDWYSVTEGQGEITYPAPFDQPFYMILNLAVGGSWPGNPDDTTDFDKAAMMVDYVKVYQKDSYDENVTKPEKEVVLRDPDKNGNYVINGDFATAEDLSDNADWIFLTALGGEGSAEIKNGAIHITTTNAGTADYSIQLVQPNIPLQRGGTYQVTFDAYADEARTMIVDVSAPDRSFKRYLADTTVALTTAKKTYTYEFTMTDKDDANGRLEFNLGNTSSTASVHISNVKLVKTGQTVIDDSKKTVLTDGNYVYNGSFQEGPDRMQYWEAEKNGAQVSVTNTDNIRRLKIVAPAGISASNPVIISQSDLALSDNGKYALSFKAEGESGKTITVIAAGNTFTAEMTGAERDYGYRFTTPENLTDKDILIKITEPGTYYLDDVRIVEDSLIKNGSFNAGFSGFEPYVDGSISSQVTYVVDSISEDNAADFSIQDTGDADWKIQLKQSKVTLEKGKWYSLKFDAKSTLDRKIQFSIQRDGSVHKNAEGGEDWTPYVQDVVSLTGGYQTFEKTFQMKEDTDEGSIFNIAMGAVGGTRITQPHRICIDNISLEEVAEPVLPPQPAGDNLLTNGNFASGSDGWDVWAITSPGEATQTIENGKITYNITNAGTEDWHIQLKQSGLTLEQGSKYRLTFKAVSSETRTIKAAMLSSGYTWYGGADIPLTQNEEKDVVIEFTMDKETDPETTMVISMGKIGDTTPPSVITLSDFSLVKLEDSSGASGQPIGENQLINGDLSQGTDGWNIWSISGDGKADASIENGKVTYAITNVGTNDWDIQLKQENLTLVKGCTYQITFKAVSSETRTIKALMQENGGDYTWYGGQDISLEKDQEQEVSIYITMNEETDSNAALVISMGKIADVDTPPSTITFSDFSLVRVE